MTQPSLLADVQRRDRPWRRVRETSRAAYAGGRERFKGRKANVLRWLAAYYNARQRCPTSAELADWSCNTTDTIGPQLGMSDLAVILEVRRGLSDLAAVRVVEAYGKRKCHITGRLSLTWRVRPR